MKVLLVSTWGVACGVAEHSFYLKGAIQNADASIEIEIESNLHPDAVLGRETLPDWTLLNYHAALHSQWGPEQVRALQARGSKALVCFHDTGVPNSAQCRALHAVADRFVIHEPAEDLPGAHYIRQGVPALTGWQSYWVQKLRNAWRGRPVVGTVGFPFPWKNYDLLAEASERAGWALALIAPKATPEQVARWQALNPASVVIPEFLNRTEVQGLLEGCDATAFLYANANTGTSAAIRLGIAARKPVLASSYGANRQNRDLWLDPVAFDTIQWQHSLTVQDIANALACVRSGPFDAGIVRLAHQDSWAKAGQVYAQLLRGETR